MGLDQYAYAAAQAGDNAKWWDGAELDPDTRQYKHPTLTKPREIAYWRKHPNLQGWMEQLWIEKGQPDFVSGPHEDDCRDGFNGVELELTWEDIERLEQAILNKQLPYTQGFFFGNPSDDEYREQDLKFCRDARADLFLGLKVFYNSSW